MNAAELHPLLPASDWWLVAAAGAIAGFLVLAGWPVFARLWAHSGARADGPAHVPGNTRREYLSKIDALDTAWRAGELSEREVAQRLGTIVRRFARSAWGIDVSHMTLAELRAHRIEPIAVAVSRLYAAEFSDEAAIDCRAELGAARKLVGRWS